MTASVVRMPPASRIPSVVAFDGRGLQLTTSSCCQKCNLALLDTPLYFFQHTTVPSSLLGTVKEPPSNMHVDGVGITTPTGHNQDRGHVRWAILRASYPGRRSLIGLT